MSVNKVILVGNLGQDPELRATQDGRELATFSLATTESWKDKNSGERKDKTEWHRIVVYSQGLVNVIKKYVTKGSKLYIEGQLQTRKWVDNSGIEKYTTEVVLQNFNSSLQMLDSRNSQPSAKDNPNQSMQDTVQDQFAGAKVVEDGLDDNIPF